MHVYLLEERLESLGELDLYFARLVEGSSCLHILIERLGQFFINLKLHIVFIFIVKLISDWVLKIYPLACHYTFDILLLILHHDIRDVKCLSISKLLSLITIKVVLVWHRYGLFA
jgi:hypothetical protein